MPSEPGSRELRGLARSIHGLFSDEMAGQARVSVDEDASADGTGGDVAWVTEAAVRLPGDVEGPDPLAEAVTEYLRAVPEDRPGLLQAVRDSGVDARGRRAGAAMADAAEALSRYSGEDPEALEVARGLVNPGVASLLVGRIQGAAGDKPRREELVGILSRLGEEVEVAVLEALRQEAMDPEADQGVRRSLLAMVAAFAAQGSDVVSRMLNEPDWRLARNAIHLLSETEADDIVPQLTVALGHSDGRVRKEALQSLARLGGEEAAILAVAQLEDQEPQVREQAARTVGVLQAERGLRPLLSLLEHEGEPEVVLEIIRALGQLGDPSAVIPLEKRAVSGFFSRRPQELRVAAYRALGAIGTPHAMQLIEKAREDRDAEVRRTAEAVLKTQEG
jgi:hypothetical protein